MVLYDSVSYSAFGHLYRNDEWLTEVVMAVIYNHLGVCGLKLWKFACVAATMVSLALALAETGASRAVQSNPLGVVALAIMPQIQFRPQLFTFMFSAQDAVLFARANMPMARSGRFPRAGRRRLPGTSREPATKRRATG